MAQTLIAQEVLAAVRRVVPGKAALHEPVFRGNEWVYVKDCLDTGWVSSVGKYVDLFEKKLEEFTEAKKAVVIVNGTAALHLALHLSGVRAQDEVLVPDLTFAAVPNAVSYLGAVPHFVDSSLSTLGLDPIKLHKHLSAIAIKKGGECFNRDTGRRIQALVAMHTFGHPVNMEPLLTVTEEFGLQVIEDAAESLGSFYKNKHTGRFGKMGILSFNGNKTVTTGGGGAILTEDESLGKKAKHLSTTAKTPHPWEFRHDAIGFNYRLPNVNAAIGCAQLEQLPGFLASKRALAMRYKDAFAQVAGLHFFEEPNDCKSNYWLNVLLLDKPDVSTRDAILSVLNQEGLQSRPAWTLMHKLPMFSDSPRSDVSCAEALEARLINIPSSAHL